MEILRIENVSKYYGEKWNEIKVLDDISLTIKKGEFVAIIGTSGSGKTTLLNIIGGIDKPTNGKVIIDGNDIQQLKDSELSAYRRRTVSMIFQFFNLIPILNVKENILLPALLDNKKIDYEKLDNLIEDLGLKEKEKMLPNQLSGGQQQRVAIGRALMCEPEIILADEPTGNLGGKSSEEIINVLEKYNKKNNQTILIVTHDMEIAKGAERIITICDGKIIKDEVQ